MEVEIFQNAVDQIRLFTVLVEAIECITCGLHRQRWDLEDLAIRGDGGDAGGDAKTNVAELGQFIHSCVNLLRTHHLWNSALSRTMSISFEDKYRRKGVRSSGLSMSAPMTLESRRRKLVWDVGN